LLLSTTKKPQSHSRAESQVQQNKLRGSASLQPGFALITTNIVNTTVKGWITLWERESSSPEETKEPTRGINWLKLTVSLLFAITTPLGMGVGMVICPRHNEDSQKNGVYRLTEPGEGLTSIFIQHKCSRLRA
jgi:hypothetical protein